MKAITFEMMPEVLSNILEYQIKLEKQIGDLQSSITERSTKPQKEILTIDETCSVLGVNRSTLHRWEKDGVISSYGIEKRRYYKYSEILKTLVPLGNKSD